MNSIYNLEALRREWQAGTRFRFLYFWKPEPEADGSMGPGCLGQWWPSSFTIDGTEYRCAEQWMMAEKARMFGDREMWEAIMASHSPKEMKALGRAVRGFQKEVWDARCYRLVLEGNLAKFSQDPVLLEYLLSSGERILVERAVELMEQGMDAQAIATRLDQEKKDIRLVALLDTLEYLKRGGRVSASVAMVGGLLAIKPVVAVQEGEVVVLGKARGSKNGNNLLIQEIQKNGGVDFGRPYRLGYTGLNDSLLQKYIADSAALWTDHADRLPIGTVGGTIGTHVGPGAIAVAFFQRH